MGRYRKKPVVIEAELWDPGRHPTDYPGWFWEVLGGNPDLFDAESGTLTIRTLEGNMVAQPGDWIIRGVKGELCPCKPDIFAATYEPAPEGAQGEEPR